MDNKFYYVPSVPNYVKQDLERFGYLFETVKDIESNVEKNLILYEHDINFCINNIKNFSMLKTYVVIIDHHHEKHKLMSKLDECCTKHQFFFLGTQYLKPLYRNIKTYSLGSSEDWCRHDFIKYLVDTWHRERNPKIEKPFLLLSARSGMPTHIERNEIIDKIKLELKNDILQIPVINEKDLKDKRIKFDQWMTKTFAGRNMLGGFGTGLPRLDLYDRTTYELVLETIYSTDTVHLTEKTWRSIACGQPAIYLINRHNIERLELLGYVLQPTKFYNKLRDAKNFYHAFDILKESLEEIKNTDTSLATQKNFNNFWRYRSSWADYIPSLTTVFGYSNLTDLVKKLKEI